MRKLKAYLKIICELQLQVYANFYVNLREGINCYKSLPKYKTIIEDLGNIIQDFEL